MAVSTYKHTQIAGWQILIPTGAGILLTGYFGILYSNWVILSVFVILVVALILFSSLTVTVDNDSIAIRFGPGVIRKTLRLGNVLSCQTVKNSPWYGWGIRLMPNGWLFNVAGLDAVEISMRDGKVHRIGTDEPERLSNAIQMRLSGRKV
jgi:hypothetical protein